MRIFESEAIYNAETGIWEESYFIDDEEVDFEEYFEEQELEVAFENEKLREEECCCDYCECKDCEEISIGDLIDYYVEVSQEGCLCRNCVRDLFLEYTNDLLSEIIDIDEEWIRV